MENTSLAYESSAPGQLLLGTLINRKEMPEGKFIRAQNEGAITEMYEVTVYYSNGLRLPTVEQTFALCEKYM